MNKPKLFQRSLFVDDRGTFENIPINILDSDTNFIGKRVYICENFKEGTVRGFHYHEKEAKIFICLSGAVKFVLLSGANSAEMALKCPEEVFTLSAKGPKNALYIPAEYANAWQSLTDDTVLIGISSATVEESINDDIRFEPEILETIWQVKWR
jgi:dTDP-4-dehydrorhamnose 3,5-epimerase